jgi:hypothetical protein
VTSGLSGVSAGGANPADMKIPASASLPSVSNMPMRLAAATSLIGGSIPGYSCDTAATPLMPYFLSTLDSAAWRTGVPESLYPERLCPASGNRQSGRSNYVGQRLSPFGVCQPDR